MNLLRSFAASLLAFAILAGCGTIIPVTGSNACCEAPDAVIKARNAAIGYVRDTFGIEALKTTLAWQEQHLPGLNSTGSVMYEYDDEGWVVTVAYPNFHPGVKQFTVTIVNTTDDFSWAGNVDETGAVFAP